MIEHITTWLLAYVLAHPTAAFSWAFLAAFGESLAFVGVFVPGTLVVIGSGFVAEQFPQLIPIKVLIAVVASGAILANIISYLIGRFYGSPLFTTYPFFQKRNYLLTRTQEYFAAHGGKSLLTAHFLGPIRSFVSFVAGVAEMPWWRFLAFTIVGCTAWATVAVGVGYVFGVSWEAIDLWSTRLTLFLIGVIFLLILNWVAGRFVARHEQEVRTVIASVARSLSEAVAANEYVRSWTESHPRLFGIIRRRFAPSHARGLMLTMGVLVWFVVLLALLAVIRAVVIQAPLVVVDVRLGEVFSFIRDPAVTRAMIAITHLGGAPIVGLAIAVTVILFLRRDRLRAIIFIVGAAVASLLSTLLKIIFDRPRPGTLDALLPTSTNSFPSGHAVAAMVIYGYVTLLLIERAQTWRRKVMLALSGITMILSVGLSRMYLGVHWSSDVLAGYLLGAWCLIMMLVVGSVLGATYGQRPIALSRWRQCIAGICLLAAGFFYILYVFTDGHVMIMPV